MSVVVVGVNHKTAPISLLEQLSISEESLPKALTQLCGFEDVAEGVILSTCNRTEVYAVVSRFHAGTQDLRNFLAEFCHVAPEDFVDRLYTYHDDGAIRHLFRVTTAIDSMVIGESEILGQVKRAFQRANEEGTVHRVLGAAFRQALRVGKRSRSETAIGRNPVSISSAAVDLARRAFSEDSLAGKRVTILGAGKMGRLAARALGTAGAEDLVVVNRSEERAEELAGIFGAEALPFERLDEAIAASDILISSTTAPGCIVGADLLERAMARRADRPLFIVDIAVPRDVEAAAADIPGVVLRGIEDLRGVVDSNRGSRLTEVSRVEEIIGEEVEHFINWERSTEFAPTAASLVAQADLIRAVEMERIKPRLDEMTEEQRTAVDHLSRRIVAKLLHTPLKKSKDVSSSKQGYMYLTALRELFDLDDEPVDDDG
jgi:glutamyl-tRNA reductase